ncbi:PTS sugar transporter subunit IIA [Alicyclobacillus contaminans]|nr:PTS sugar transporter subunit IIA [Alicyclobacillus contaminans]
MVEKTLTITNKSGLHARPAALLVKEAGRHTCQVTLRKGDKEVDAKSILGVMSLAVAAGDAVTIRTDGPDEAEALAAVVQLLESGLGE